MRSVSTYENNHKQANETPMINYYVNRIVLFIVIQIHNDIWNSQIS